MGIQPPSLGGEISTTKFENSLLNQPIAMKTALLLLAFAGCAASAFGQAGALDGTFGIGGKIIPDQTTGNGEYGMAIQPDGKIVVAATDFSGNFVVYRYLPNAARDESFGTNGQVITAFEIPDQPVEAFAKLVAVQPDG